ncbi:tail fiber protein [Pedobacter sp. N36a]|uniref:phage tail protein n=1 Tax=Pedobacter sp. N36a TaxID=2767996 RepID=UPI00165701D6|nr:tail fiber protein [Pedobacter sp. N36a]MBC8986198.1 tail fiber protein [Pedobacter sp. N36a]
MEEYLGMIKAFAGNFVPRGFLPCNGQLIPIQQNAALFAILGTTYGGDGQNTFGIPDFRGRAAIGTGQGAGLANHVLGEKIGVETVSISTSNMPIHTHTATTTITMNVSAEDATLAVPVANSAIAVSVDATGDPAFGFNSEVPEVPIAGVSATTVNAAVGGSLPISIQQPTLAINYLICTEGLFPSRN